MFTLSHTTIFESMLTAELEDLETQHKPGEVSTHTYSAPKFVSGNILAPISPDKQSTVDLTSTYRFAQPKHDQLATYDTNDFLDKMKTTVITIEEKVDYVRALSIIADYIDKAGSNFYGAILRNSSNHLINPLHPLVALASAEQPPAGVFKLILYFYSDRPAYDKQYKTYEANHEYIQANINAQLRAYSTDAITTALCTAVESDYENYSLEVEFRTKQAFSSYQNIQRASANKEYYLSAQQVLTRGIFVPYYGTSIIRKTPDGSGEGLSLSPFLAVNIGSPRTDEYNSDTSIFTGICTGSQPRSTLEGIRVLTHANLSSPMNSNTILPTALAFADHCINTSISIYNKADILAKAPIIPIDYSESDPLADIDPEHIKLFLEDQNKFSVVLLRTMKTKEIVSLYKTLLSLDRQGKLDEYKIKKSDETSQEENDDTVYNHDGQTDPRQEELS